MRWERINVVTLGWVAMFQAWFRRRVDVGGKELKFEGWLPFGSFALAGSRTVVYFLPFAPKWFRAPGEFSVQQLRRRFRAHPIAEHLWLHESVHHIVRDREDHPWTPLGSRFGLGVRVFLNGRTPSVDERQEAWKELGDAVARVVVRRG